MHIDDAFPSKYIKAGNLSGKEHAVEIARIEIETMGDDRKPVLYFAGKQKGMVLNRTNADMIADSYGPDMDEWIGKSIVLYPDRVAFQGKIVDAIRCKVARRQTTVQREKYELSTGNGAPVDDDLEDFR